MQPDGVVFDSPRTPAGKGELAGVSLLLVVALCVAAPVLGHGFVFDDRDFLVDNPTIHTPSGLLKGFCEPYWNSAGHSAALPYHRPLGITAFTALWLLGGGRAWVFHLASLAIHLACAVLVVRIARRAGATPWGAALGGMLFALHPAQVETFAWSTCLTELMSTAGVLAALHAWLRRRPAAMGTWLLAGLLAKESAVAGAVVLGLAEVLGARSRRVFLALFLASLAALVLRVGALGWPAAVRVSVPAPTVSGLSSHPSMLDLGGWMSLQQLRIIAPGAGRPFADPPAPAAPSDPRAWLLLILPSACLLSLILLLRHSSAAHAPGPAVLGLLLATAGILPSVLVGDLARPPLADRFLHLPLAGSALVASACITRASRVSRAAARCAIIVGAILALGAAARSAAILPHWRCDETFFRWAVASGPQVALPYAGRAQSLLDQAQALPRGHPDRIRFADAALEILRIGARRVAGLPHAPVHGAELIRTSEGHARYVRGDLAGAERIYLEVLDGNSVSLAAHLGMGCLLAQKGEDAWGWGAEAEAAVRLRAALEHFTIVLDSSPWSLTGAREGAARARLLLAACSG